MDERTRERVFHARERAILGALVALMAAAACGPGLELRVQTEGEAAAGATVVLDASATTTEDGVTLDFSWEQMAGPDIDLMTDGALARFVVPQSAVGSTVELELVVEDGAGRRQRTSVTRELVAVEDHPTIVVYARESGEMGPPTSLFVLRQGEGELTRISPAPGERAQGAFAQVRSQSPSRVVFTVDGSIYIYDLATNERIEATESILAAGFDNVRQFYFDEEGADIYAVATRDARDAILTFRLDSPLPVVLYQVPEGLRIGDIPGHGADPYPSPSGQQLAFMLENPAASEAFLAVVDSDSGQAWAISQPLPLQGFVDGYRGGIGTFTWSAAGDQILYTADEGAVQSWSTFLTDVVDPVPVEVVPDQAGAAPKSYYGARARLTADAQWVVYEAIDADDNRELYVIAASGTEAPQRLHPALQQGESITQFGWRVDPTGANVSYEVASGESPARYRWLHARADDPGKGAALTPWLADQTYLLPAPAGASGYLYTSRQSNGVQALVLSDPVAGIEEVVSSGSTKLPDIFDFLFWGAEIVYSRGSQQELAGRSLRVIRAGDEGADDVELDVEVEAGEVIARWTTEKGGSRIAYATADAGGELLRGFYFYDAADDEARVVFRHWDDTLELINMSIAWPE